MRREHYRSPDDFHARIGELAHEAVAGLDDAPTLVAFPEAIALPLAFTTLGVGDAPTVRAAALAAIGQRPWRLGRLALRARRLGPSLLWLLSAHEVFTAYTNAFRAAAAATGATIVAGSAFLPRIDREPARGIYLADPPVRNVSFAFGPGGSSLGARAKVHLMPSERRAGIAPAPWQDLQPVRTPVGAIGIAVCLDAFHAGVLDRLDGLGAQVVVQPSANHAPWDRPWPADKRLTEGEAWLRYGLRAQVQGRLHARIGVNPMLVGRFMDLAPRGRSNIVAAVESHPGHAVEGWPGVVALAPHPDREAFVRATLEVPGPGGSGASPAAPAPLEAAG